MLPALDAILGHKSAHSFATGPVIAEPAHEKNEVTGKTGQTRGLNHPSSKTQGTARTLSYLSFHLYCLLWPPRYLQNRETRHLFSGMTFVVELPPLDVLKGKKGWQPFNLSSPSATSRNSLHPTQFPTISAGQNVYSQSAFHFLRARERQSANTNHSLRKDLTSSQNCLHFQV